MLGKEVALFSECCGGSQLAIAVFFTAWWGEETWLHCRPPHWWWSQLAMPFSGMWHQKMLPNIQYGCHFDTVSGLWKLYPGYFWSAFVYLKLPSWRLITLTYLLTPWSRILLEKLTGFQIVKKFPASYGTRRFITAFACAHNLSFSWARSIQSIPPHPTSWRSVLMSSSCICLGLPHVVSFPQVSPPKPCGIW
jgi:hypothetical protein